MYASLGAIWREPSLGGESLLRLRRLADYKSEFIKLHFLSIHNQSLPSVWFGFLPTAYSIALGFRRILSYMSSSMTSIRCKYCRKAQSCKRETPKNRNIVSSKCGDLPMAWEIGVLTRMFGLNGGVYACEITIRTRKVKTEADFTKRIYKYFNRLYIFLSIQFDYKSK